MRPPSIAAWCSLFLLFAPAVQAAEDDPALVARAAIAYLEHAPMYSWEFRDLDGESGDKTVWKEPAANADLNGPGQRSATVRRMKVRMLSPTVQGAYRPDGWAVTEAGFAKGPKVLAVLHPSGARVVRSVKGEWQTFGKFRSENHQVIADPGVLTDRKDQMTYSSYWAAFMSPLPHVLLPELMRDATHFRVEKDEIVAEVSIDSARLLLGHDGDARKLAPGRFKGNARMRVREGILRECRIKLDYDVDLTEVKKPSIEGIDILILFLPPATEPPAVPEGARTLLSAG